MGIKILCCKWLLNKQLLSSGTDFSSQIAVYHALSLSKLQECILYRPVMFTGTGMICPHTLHPVRFGPVQYVPVHYFPMFLCPRTFHPWMSGNQQNTTNHVLVGHLAEPNLGLDMVSHNQQDCTNPWIGWAFSLTYPSPEYGLKLQDETYEDIKMPRYNIWGRIVWGLNVWGHNVWGHIVPVPCSSAYRVRAVLTPIFQSWLSPLRNGIGWWNLTC
jgi:hypothetical protein